MSSGNGGNGGGGGFSMPGGGGFTMPENGSGFTMPESGSSSGFPGGFPGETENHSDQWIMFGACVVLLLAVTLIIWRTKAHNS